MITRVAKEEIREDKNHIAPTNFRNWKSNLRSLPFQLIYMYISTGAKHGEGAKLNFRNQLKASVRRSWDDIGASLPLSFLLLVDSRSPSSFRDPPSCSNYRLRNSSFFFPIVPGRIIERRERGNLSRNNRALAALSISLFSPSVFAARLIYFIDFQPVISPLNQIT